MDVTFRIAVPTELAAHLLAASELSAVATRAEVSEQEKGRLNFDLGTAADVITIVVGLATLGDYAMRLAVALLDWRKRNNRDTEVVLQGLRQDRKITITASVTVEVLTKEIEVVARD